MLKQEGINISSSVIFLKHTAANDLKFHLVDVDTWVSEANIHVVTHNAKYGNFDEQLATITTNDVPFFHDFNIADLYFKNAGVGDNTTIYLVGIRMTEARKQELGLIP